MNISFRRNLKNLLASEQKVIKYFMNHCNIFRYFIDEIDLHGMEIDIALRHTLTFFRLPGEAQKIERIMEVNAIY